MASIVESTSPNAESAQGDFSKLSSHPMFSELQATLASDCYQASVPYNLCEDSPEDVEPGLNPAAIAVQEANLQSEFRQVISSNSPKVQELQLFYHTQCAEIEGQRNAAVTKLKQATMPSPAQYQTELQSIHLLHDRQRMHLTNRVMGSLHLLKAALPPLRNGMAFQQNKSKARQLSVRATTIMQDWFDRHIDNPYPTEEEKADMADAGGISIAQVKAWFANKRNRTNNTKPKKQKKSMEKQLLTICSDLTTDGRSHSTKLYGDIIQQLSDIVHTADPFALQRLDPYPNPYPYNTSPSSVSSLESF